MGQRRACGAWLLAALLLLGGAVPAPQARPDLERRIQAAAQKLASGDALGALLDLESVLAQDDTLWAAFFQRGRAQVQLGDDLGARESFLRAAQLNPGNADLHFLIASAALQLADFETSWTQAIAAHQAGYEPRAAEALFKQLQQYVPAPGDLQARLDAPKVAVVVAAGEEDEALEDVSLSLRTLLVHAARVALVQDLARARHRVDLSRPRPGALLMVAAEIATSRELGRRETTLPDSGPDSSTDLALSAFVTDLERWLDELP